MKPKKKNIHSIIPNPGKSGNLSIFTRLDWKIEEL